MVYKSRGMIRTTHGRDRSRNSEHARAGRPPAGGRRRSGPGEDSKVGTPEMLLPRFGYWRSHGPRRKSELCGERLGRFKDLLLGDVPVARQALRKLLPEPLKVLPAFTGGRRTLRFEGDTLLGPRLRHGVYKGLASPRGFEPRLPP
jgi:hypothetical protein